MTHHITDEQIDKVLREIDSIAREVASTELGLPLDADDDQGKPHAKMREAIRTAIALAAPRGEPTISMKHGPWLPSAYDEGETYCQRCKTRSIFASNRQCDPHIVYTAPAPAVPSEWRLEDIGPQIHIYAPDGKWTAVRPDADSPARTHIYQFLRAMLTAAPTPPAQGEKLVRFCPGCGSVGDVPDTFRDCCPDGSRARMIPENLAARCHDLFLLALDGAKAQQPAVPEDVARVNKQMLDALEDFHGYRESDGPAPPQADPVEIDRKQMQSAVARFVEQNRAAQAVELPDERAALIDDLAKWEAHVRRYDVEGACNPLANTLQQARAALAAQEQTTPDVKDTP